ncbi:type III pantothenate kinase [bacterium]|nr:type III pantothenate kinase [bacterium]
MSDLYLKIGNSSIKTLYNGKIKIIDDLSGIEIQDGEKVVYYFTNKERFQENNAFFLQNPSNEFNRERITLIKNGYTHPEEIGIDRLLGASFFYRKYKKDLIFVDLGTAITINIIRDRTLTGGYILPGPLSYFDAMGKIGTLPKISTHGIDLVPGKTTKDNIVNGYFLLLKGFFDKIKRVEALPLYASGGNKDLLDLGEFIKYEDDVDLKEMKNYEET